ncbi:TorF family putative porin [Sphingomonas sp. RHCKR47]|uniref:TorF family putative porin n=1 Tax=Sphingomonas citricola TaxID=2862498 RepID=UPI001CA5E8BC|nr:TorF family putative porin [Sphingomonas citricola]MBW6523561.1 TorF family putative porin [Sphingomonas citricola]
MRIYGPVLAAALLVHPLAAQAQTASAGQPDTAAPEAPPPAITVSGSAAIVSDYRFRGVSQSDRQMAVQGGITVSHDSGLYVGTWGSNLAGWGTFGGANMELDLIGGYKAKLADNATLDVGLTWYVYPGGADKTDFAEPYAKLTGTAGPATLTAGVAYAPKQQAIGKWYNTGADAAAGVYNRPGAKDDNLYLWGDGAAAVPGTPITAKAHVGHSWGQDGLGPNATAVSPTGAYWDWSLGADATYRNLTFNVSYVDTDISNRDAAYLRPSFSKGQDGTGNIANGTIVVSLTAAF